MTPEEHLDSLVRHIGLVRDACLLLGRRLMAKGRHDFGRHLIAHGFVHDASKFHGIEWECLHKTGEVPPDRLQLAVEHHRRTNEHHPEYWGGIENMPELFVAEMVCDWYARSQEFGTDLREWIRDHAQDRYHIDPRGEQHAWIAAFVETLLGTRFG